MGAEGGLAAHAPPLGKRSGKTTSWVSGTGGRRPRALGSGILLFEIIVSNHDQSDFVLTT